MPVTEAQIFTIYSYHLDLVRSISPGMQIINIRRSRHFDQFAAFLVVLGTLCTMPRYDVSASWLYSKMAD